MREDGDGRDGRGWGTGVTHDTRVTPSREDGSLGRDCSSATPGHENFQANAAGKVGHQRRRFGGFGTFKSLAEVSTAALDFDSECPELTPQNG